MHGASLGLIRLSEDGRGSAGCSCCAGPASSTVCTCWTPARLLSQTGEGPIADAEDNAVVVACTSLPPGYAHGRLHDDLRRAHGIPVLT